MEMLLVEMLLIGFLFWPLFGAFVADFCGKYVSYFAVFRLFMSFFLIVYVLFCVGFQHSVVTISLFTCTCFQVLVSTLSNFLMAPPFIFVASCDSVVVSAPTTVTSLDFYNFFLKLFALFLLFVATLAVARHFFQSSITDTLAGNVISVYFFSFIVYRVYHGWSMHPFIFALVSFGFFFLQPKKMLPRFLSCTNTARILLLFVQIFIKKCRSLILAFLLIFLLFLPRY